MISNPLQEVDLLSLQKSLHPSKFTPKAKQSNTNSQLPHPINVYHFHLLLLLTKNSRIVWWDKKQQHYATSSTTNGFRFRRVHAFPEDDELHRLKRAAQNASQENILYHHSSSIVIVISHLTYDMSLSSLHVYIWNWYKKKWVNMLELFMCVLDRITLSELLSLNGMTGRNIRHRMKSFLVFLIFSCMYLIFRKWFIEWILLALHKWRATNCCLFFYVIRFTCSQT